MCGARFSTARLLATLVGGALQAFASAALRLSLRAALVTAAAVLESLERFRDTLNRVLLLAHIFFRFFGSRARHFFGQYFGRAARFSHMFLCHAGQVNLRIGRQARCLLLINTQLFGHRLAGSGGCLEEIFRAVDRDQMLASNPGLFQQALRKLQIQLTELLYRTEQRFRDTVKKRQLRFQMAFGSRADTTRRTYPFWWRDALQREFQGYVSTGQEE